ncbi:MAG: helix-turn-helix domain-containing protein [Candidatus Hadarchaeales archaeon]
MEFLKIKDVAKRLGMTRATVWLYCKTGKIRAVRAGPRCWYRIPAEEVLRLEKELGLAPPSTLTLAEAVSRLSPSDPVQRQYYGILLEQARKLSTFTPKDLESATGLPLQLCVDFCNKLPGAGLADLDERSRVASTKGLIQPAQCRYRLKEEIR